MLCGSRGGLIAMLAQFIVAALLFSVVVRPEKQIQLTTLASAAESPVHGRSALVLILALMAGVVLGTIWLGGDQSGDQDRAIAERT